MTTTFKNENYPYYEFTESSLMESFDLYIEEIYGTTEILGMIFDTAQLLKDADYVAYEEAFSNWLDSEGYEEV